MRLVPRVNIACIDCGAIRVFKPSQVIGPRCKSCAQKLRQDRTPLPRFEQACVDCGKIRSYPESDYGRQTAANSTRCKSCYYKWKVKPRTEAICEFCDKTFEPTLKQKNPKYCSADCYNDYRHSVKQTSEEKYKRIRSWIKNNSARVNANSRKRYRETNQQARKYGLTKERFQTLLAKGCWLCGGSFEGLERRDIAIDHDHKTEVVRGLAHVACNFLIGHAKESVELLMKVAASLQRYQSTEVWVA